MQQLHFTLTGRPISKKNSKRIFSSGSGRPRVLPSVAYEKYKQSCLEQIMILRSKGVIPRETITGLVQVGTYIAVKGKYNVDADNIHTSILDILQDARVIENDDLVNFGMYSKTGMCEEWSVDVVINYYEGKS